jgi:multimeric flavodoxin WrbA
MSIRLVALNGSPRQGGNTEALLGRAIEGARSAGAEVETFVLNYMDIRPCQNCGYCETRGVCRFADQDDMRSIYQALDAGDCFVAASPIYFATVSAQMKTMIDRCQALWARKFLLKQRHANPDRCGIFLAVGGFPHRRFWPCAETVARTWFLCCDIKYLGGLFYHKIDGRGEIAGHPSALQEAFDAGRRLVAGDGPDPRAAGFEKKEA